MYNIANYYNDSDIVDNRKKPYGVYTISKYRIEDVLEEIKKSIKNNNFYHILYFITELHASGKYQNIINIFINYSIFNFSFNMPFFPSMLWNFIKNFKNLEILLKKKKKSIMDLRNSYKFRKNLWLLCQYLKISKNIDIDEYISETFFKNLNNNNNNYINNDANIFDNEDFLLNELFKGNNFNNYSYYIINFKNILKKVINRTDNEKFEKNKNKLFFYLGKIINYDKKNTKYIDRKNFDNETIFYVLWNIILNISKQNKLLFNEILNLYNIYKYILKNNNFNKDIKYLKYIIINSILYVLYFDKIKWDTNIIEYLSNTDKFKKMNIFYQNIQQSIKNRIKRYDYIDLKKKKIKKLIVIKKKIVNTNEKKIINIEEKIQKYNLLNIENSTIDEKYLIVPNINDIFDNNNTNIYDNDLNLKKIKNINISSSKKRKRKKKIIIEKI